LGHIKGQIIFNLSNPTISYEEDTSDLKILYSAILAVNPLSYPSLPYQLPEVEFA
jgi:hypothetical protein